MTTGDDRKHVLLLLSPLTYRAGAFLDAAERLDLTVTKGIDMPRTLADYWHQPFGLDFSRPEESVVTIAEQATATPFDAIISVDDSASLLAAQASAALGLAHNAPAAALAARDKRVMREALHAGGVPVPAFTPCLLSDDPAALATAAAYPCVIKPVLLSGSRGVIRANDPAEFVAAFGRLHRLLVGSLQWLVSQVLTFDYLGALAVAIAFPLLFVPQLGLIRTGAFFGLLNAGIAVWALWLFRGELRGFAAHALACAATLAVLALAFAGADRVTTWAEDRFYGDRVVYSESSAYQRIVVTASGSGIRLFLNGNLQFHSRDEYRYHEALVHPALAAAGAPRRVLVLGGGDGMAVREVLKAASVEQVTLVELDPNMTRLFASEPMLRKLNGDSLHSPRLRIVNADAFAWLGAEGQLGAMFDVIVVDFPDPTNFSIGKLYTKTFYQLIDQHLAAGGYAVVQTTSPLIARQSFWTVVATLEAAGLATAPYHAHVPSFGEWGFVIAGRRPFRMPTRLPAGLRFLDVAGLASLFDFPPDMARVPAEVNRLSNQVLVQTFEKDWGRVQR